MYEFGKLLHWFGFWGCHNLQIKIGGQRGRTSYGNSRWGGMNEGMISNSPIYPRLQCRNNKIYGGNIDTVGAQPTALATSREEGTRN